MSIILLMGSSYHRGMGITNLGRLKIKGGDPGTTRLFNGISSKTYRCLISGEDSFSKPAPDVESDGLSGECGLYIGGIDGAFFGDDF